MHDFVNFVAGAGVATICIVVGQVMKHADEKHRFYMARRVKSSESERPKIGFHFEKPEEKKD